MNFGNFKGAAKRLDDIDLPRIGHRIGVGEDEIRAVMDVEAAGTGFDRQGRPRMLFEPHIFYRELGAGDKRDRAVRAGLAYARWKPGAYPSDSYPRLAQAMAIDAEAAVRSASWGLGQIMGFNHKLAGYPTAEAMVRDFMADEENHLNAMVSFIISTGLDDEIRRHDWAGFARGYNGAGYRANQYDTKLASRFAFWRKIKDTPWTPENDNGPPVTGTVAVVLRRGDKGPAVAELQRDLTAIGLYSDSTNGTFGPATEAAVIRFQKSAGLLDDGWAGVKTLDALKAAVAAKNTVPVPEGARVNINPDLDAIVEAVERIRKVA